DEMFGVIATVGVKYAGATGYILFESSGEISTLIKEPSSTQGNSKIPQIFTGGDTVKLHISVGSFDKEIDIVVDGNMTVDLNYNDLKAE
ncbi:MAG: hypothetical protein HKM93_17300, partial [Desulfobacteraceae bacterium]|nr:hypothetical protein [Desulfobacteraceae bacterium]